MEEIHGVHYTRIEEWIKEHSRHAQYSYITMRATPSKLDGCVAFNVTWLQLEDIKTQVFHFDRATSEIVHVTRYV